MDPSPYVQLHEQVKPITWALSLFKKDKSKTLINYAAGFCVSSEGLIMTCARTFVGLDRDTIEIKARRLDVNNSVNATILYVKDEWDMAMLKVEGHDCQVGVLVADNAFRCAQPLLCIGHLLHSVGSYRLGRVAFNVGEYVRTPRETDNGMKCETYGSDAWEFAPDSRILGHIWNKRFFKQTEEKKKRSKSESFEFEKQLHPLVPLIHCNGFSTQLGCWGAPIFNLRGEIAGMLISKADTFDIGIHVAALRIFKEEALKKIGGGPSGSADIEGGLTVGGRAMKKTRTK